MTRVCITLVGLMLFTMLLQAAQPAHPVYPPDPAIREQAESRTRQAMLLSPEELAAMVPEATGKLFCGCPNCHGGAAEYDVLRWEYGMQDQAKCRYCGMVFPNEQFPENREETIIAPSGLKQTYRWHEDAQGNQYHFQGRAWFERSYTWAPNLALDLATLYALTGDTAYGDRAAALVGRFARLYPDYPLRHDYPFQPIRFWPADHKYPYPGASGFERPSKYYHWYYGDIPETFIRAYDLLAGGYDFSRIEPIVGPNIEAAIHENLFRMSYDFMIARPDPQDNMMPYVYESMIVAGRVGNYPEMVQHAIDGARTLANGKFTYDGWWCEGAPAYHWQTVELLLFNLSRALGATTDTQPRQSTAPAPADLTAEIPILRQALQVAREGVLPNGRMIPINDTYPTDRHEPTTTSVSRLWGGMGHALLGAGSGATQFQVHLNWSGHHGHSHMDNGSILLYAFGKEMLSDIGYSYTRLRSWTLNSASHNMVVIDSRSQPSTPGDARGQDTGMGKGNLLYYHAGPRVGVLDLDASPAYPGSSQYRRRLVHLHAGEGRDYVVDLFDVAGGETHDFFLHGSSDEPGPLKTQPSIDTPVETLVPDWGGRQVYQGATDLDITGERFHPYDLLTDIHSADAAPVWTADWSYGEHGLRAHLFAMPGSVRHRFQSPGIRMAGEDSNKLDQSLRWGIMQRHAGGPSRFAAVYEPYAGNPWLGAVTHADGVFTVEHGGGSDTIVLSEDRVRVTSSAGWEFDSGEPLETQLIAVEREGAFSFLLKDSPAKASGVRVTFPGGRSQFYPVEAVEGNWLRLSGDPGFSHEATTGQTAFHFFPHDRFAGPVEVLVYP